MNNQRIKRELESIEMPEEMKDRILAGCRDAQKKGEVIPMKKEPARGKRLWKILVVAAVLVVFAVPVLAGQGDRLQNPTILADAQAVEEEGARLLEEEGSYAVSGPGRSTPHSLAEMTEARRMKWDGWLSEETMGGTVITSMVDWVGMEVLEDQGPVKVREVYEKGGGVKTEYAAEDPTDLQGLGAGYVTWDLTWMNEHYTYVPGADFYYMIEDRWGNLLGEHATALYTTEDEGAWFSLDYSYDSTYAYDGSGDLVAESSYDAIYPYTTAEGHTFLLMFNGDCVWAECQTTYARVGLYGGYLKAEQLEELLDNLSLTIGETSEE